MSTNGYYGWQVGRPGTSNYGYPAGYVPQQPPPGYYPQGYYPPQQPPQRPEEKQGGYGQTISEIGEIVGKANDARAATGTSYGDLYNSLAGKGASSASSASSAVPMGSTYLADGTTPAYLMSDKTVVAQQAFDGGASGGLQYNPSTFSTVAPYLGVAGAAAGAYGMYNAYQNRKAGQGALSGLGMAGGLSAAAPLLGLGPMGWAGYAGLMAVGAIVSQLNRKKTKDYQKERWGALHPSVQEGFSPIGKEDDGIWKEGKYAGEKWTWEKAKDLAKDDPRQLIGTLSHFRTLGDEEWVHTPAHIQEETVRRILAEDGYKSEKGDILMKDEDRARAIFDAVRGEAAQGAQFMTTVDAPQQAPGTPSMTFGGPPSAEAQAQFRPGFNPSMGQAVSSVSDVLSDPKARAGYDQMSRNEKNTLWKEHRDAMGA